MVLQGGTTNMNMSPAETFSFSSTGSSGTSVLLQLFQFGKQASPFSLVLDQNLVSSSKSQSQGIWVLAVKLIVSWNSCCPAVRRSEHLWVTPGPARWISLSCSCTGRENRCLAQLGQAGQAQPGSDLLFDNR